MNFRFFEDLVGSAPGASQEWKHSVQRMKTFSKKLVSKDYWKILEDLH